MPRGRKVDIRSARHQRFVARVENCDRFMNAIARGVEKGNKLYTKPYDVALAVLTELKLENFQIIPKPTKKRNK